jgi:hypothetical protein
VIICGVFNLRIAAIVHCGDPSATCSSQIVVRHRRADMCHVTYPLSGHLFLFRNRRGDRLKILAWDHGGFRCSTSVRRSFALLMAMFLERPLLLAVLEGGLRILSFNDEAAANPDAPATGPSALTMSPVVADTWPQPGS